MCQLEVSALQQAWHACSNMADSPNLLWCQAESPAALADAAAVMRRNAAELAEGAAPAPGPPHWLNMLGPAALAAAELRPRARAGGRAAHQPHVRCSIM